MNANSLCFPSLTSDYLREITAETAGASESAVPRNICPSICQRMIGKTDHVDAGFQVAVIKANGAPDITTI